MSQLLTRMNMTRVRRGFSLIETIAAVVILAIAIPPMLWSVREAHAHRANPILSSRARWLATERLEEVIADRHSNTRGYSYLVTSNYPIESPVAGAAGYTRQVFLRETGPDLVSAGTGYLTVTVRVGWTDSEATARTMDIVAVVTEYTP